MPSARQNPSSLRGLLDAQAAHSLHITYLLRSRIATQSRMISSGLTLTIHLFIHYLSHLVPGVKVGKVKNFQAMSKTVQFF